MIFKDRKDAGRQLASALRSHFLENALVIGLPRGGVVIAAVVASELNLPLDIIIPRKIGAPQNQELAIGALAGDIVLLNQELIRSLSVNNAYLQSEIERQKKEAQRRDALYRHDKQPIDFKDKTVILVDDGIATGATMLVSLHYLLQKGAKRRIIAVPVAPPETIDKFKKECEEIVCLFTPPTFMAVGQFYEHFPQTEDDEVLNLLWK